MVESSAKVRPWRDAVRQEAIATGLAITSAPIYLRLAFRFKRPKSHFNTKGQLRASAPLDLITRPDLDKLCRSTLDGLTGVLFSDDSQVAFMVASKQYCTPGDSDFDTELEGCQIEIKTIE
jgi:crossover junction endodeoxyribonuclease RusA